MSDAAGFPSLLPGGEPAARGLVLTNLFATPSQPMRGIFNRQQFAELARRHALMFIVPEPSRWPPTGRIRSEYELEDFPESSMTLLRAWHPPGIGRVVNATILHVVVRYLMARKIRAWAPDFILGSFAYPDGVAAVMLGRALGIPAFIKIHGSDINLMGADPCVGPQLRWAFRRARGVISVSRALLEQMRTLGMRTSHSCVVYNGVDRDRFKPRDRQEARRLLGLREAGRSILYVGNLKRDKGVIDLLAAFEKVAVVEADVELNYVGSGAMGQEIQQRAGQCGLAERVHVRGARPHGEIPAWIGACDVLCLPSHAEGVPNVVVEAQAGGRPVVATRVGGVPEVLGPEGGLLVPAHDPNALAAALARVLDTHWDPDRIASSCHVHGWSDSAGQLADFIDVSLRTPRID